MAIDTAARYSAGPLAFLLLFLTHARAENLLTNGDMEGPTAKDGSPLGWSLSWKATRSTDDPKTLHRLPPDFGVDRHVRHSGQQSVRIGIGRAEDDAVLRQAVNRLPAGKTIYRVRAWIKTKGLQRGDARVTVSFGGAGGKWLAADYGLIRVEADTDWTCHAALFAMPPETIEIRVGLWVNHLRTGPATVWFDDLSLEATDLKDIPPMHYVDRRTMPPLLPGEEARGYVAFKTNYLDMVFPETIPTREVIGAELSAFASPGEYEPMSFALRALRSLDHVQVRVDDLAGPGNAKIPASAIDVRSVRSLPKKPHYSKLQRMQVPAVLEKRESLKMTSATTQPYLITIHTPADALAGVYRGQVHVAAQDIPALSIPMRFEVLPIRLLEPEGVCLGMYDSEKCYDCDPDALYQKYLDMREHGMTSVGFCGGLGGRVLIEDGTARIEWDDAKGLPWAMKCFQRAGLRGPLHWLMSGVTEQALKQGPLDSPQFAAAYRGIIEATLAEAQRRRWPEIVFQSEDEAFEHRSRWDRMLRTLEILKSIPGVRTEADGMNGNPEGLEKVLPLLDVLNYHDGPHLVRRVYDGVRWEQFVDRLQQAGKQIWFYNIDTTGYHPEIMRFGYGFHLIRCRAKGSYCWAYQWGGPDPYTDPPKGFSFMFRYPPLGNEPGGPSTGWEATREGVDDYRYWLTYRAAADAALRSDDTQKRRIVAETDAILSQALAKIQYDDWTQPGHQGRWTGGEKTDEDGVKICSGQYKLPNGWDFNEPDRLRRILADAIIRLQP